ncbi:nitroreductase [Hydrogenovibrio sp. 3SP14C1]|uniref:nitroreductase family protein n=1 Tax=Hydrogenovibrio sp. 3SP14C1 TaxID=3038774 RepID=UPI002417581A|nr:nitroreductase [Hydrogenovibrio sp. 3SP14C1]MDG4813567.1 nitroreductase [Hydrogenovibrio sp. 3SP14C1]
MSILEIIKSRRTIYQFKSKLIPLDLVNHCLEASIWAPNHKMTEPWRFWVIGQETQAKLADIYAENRALKRTERGSDTFDEIYQKAIVKFQAIPQVILVGQVLAQEPVTIQEDYAACSCAIQNFQLAAWDTEIGVQWSTGPIIEDKRTYELLSINSSQLKLIGALYMGFPECVGKSVRQPIERVTTYLA